MGDFLYKVALAMALIGVGMLVLALWGVDVPVGLACAMGCTGGIVAELISVFSLGKEIEKIDWNKIKNTNNNSNKDNGGGTTE